MRFRKSAQENKLPDQQKRYWPHYHVHSWHHLTCSQSHSVKNQGLHWKVQKPSFIRKILGYSRTIVQEDQPKPGTKRYHARKGQYDKGTQEYDWDFWTQNKQDGTVD